MDGISLRLKQARKQKGYTQDSLAKAIGVSRGVISNIEYNKVTPQPLVIHAICSVLQIQEEWLLTGNGRMEISQDLERSALLLSEIYSCSKELSEEEQDYILDMIKTFQRHRDPLAQGTSLMESTV